MDLTTLGSATVIVAASLFLFSIALIALIAAGHRDGARRADAARVLDRLLRFVEHARRRKEIGQPSRKPGRDSGPVG
jgi:hypothetical protein